MDTSPVLSYHTPAHRNEGLRIFIFYYGLNLIIAGAVVGYVAYVVPHFREIYNDFRTELPPLTTWVLNASDTVTNGGWVWLIPLTALFLALIPAFLYKRFDGRPWPRRFLSASMLLFYFGVAGFLLVVVIQPFFRLVTSVKGGGP